MADNSVLREGIKFYSEGAYEKALGFFLALPADSGADTNEISYYLGLCNTKLKKYDDALLYLEQVVTSGVNLEKTLQCRFLLAIIYVETGRKRLADFELNKLLDTGYMTASVYAAIAYIAWEQKDFARCLDFYEKSLEKDPENISSLNGLGYVLACQEKDLTKALTLCKQAVKIAPRSAACLDSLGWVYYKMGLYDDALQYLQQAEQIDTDSVEIADHIQSVKLRARR